MKTTTNTINGNQYQVCTDAHRIFICDAYYDSVEEYVEINMALCEGRHIIPQAINGAIMPGDITAEQMKDEDVLSDLAADGMRSPIKEASSLLEYIDYTEHDTYYSFNGLYIHLNLYVTGLTVALIGVLNWCHHHDIWVTLYHYDRESGKYFPQELAWL